MSVRSAELFRGVPNQFELSEEDRQEMTPSDLAAHEGDFDRIPNLETLSSEECFRLFWYAARAGRVKILEKILEILIDSRSGRHFKRILTWPIDILQTYRGDTALHAAARKAQIAAIEYLLDDVAKKFWIPESSSRNELSVNIFNKNGQTPLHVASAEEDSIPSKERIEAIEYLIAHGAFPDLPDGERVTAYSIWRKRGWDISRELCPPYALSQSIALGSLGEFSKVFEAFSEHFKSSLEPGEKSFQMIFSRYGIDPFCDTVTSSAPFKTKKTMVAKLAKEISPTFRGLFFAAKRGEDRLVRLFLEHGADATQKDIRGKVPLHEAMTGEIVRILARSSDIEVRDSRGRTPLHVAMTRGRMGAARVLLEMRASPEAKDNQGNTPLHYVRSAECAQLIFEKGALVNAQNIYQETPLHSAIDRESDQDLARGDTEVVFALLEKKPNLTLKARMLVSCGEQNLVRKNMTPLELARYRLKSARNLEIKETLQSIVQLLESAQPQESSCLIS